MWSDKESNIDYLNFEETSDLVTDLISNKSLLPISVGIFGGWGSGKSTLLNLSKQKLEKNKKNIIIEFDAWLYQDFDNARSALLEAVSTSLLALAKDNPNTLDKAKSLFKRVNKLRALGLFPVKAYETI